MSHKLIAWLTGILTLALAGFAFVLSFNALTDLAAKHGVSIPPLFPFVVEAAVVVFSLNALYRSLSGDPAKVQWALIIGSSLLAGFFNVAHAAPDLLSRLMAAMPSLFLLLSFESFLSLVKHRVTRQDLTANVKSLTGELDSKRKELDTLSAKVVEARTLLADIKADQMAALQLNTVSNIEESNTKNNTLLNAKEGKRQERLDTLLDYLAGNPEATLTEAANQVGVSRQTVSSYVNELTQGGKLHKNGSGWEVSR